MIITYMMSPEIRSSPMFLKIVTVSHMKLAEPIFLYFLETHSSLHWKSMKDSNSRGLLREKKGNVRSNEMAVSSLSCSLHVIVSSRTKSQAESSAYPGHHCTTRRLHEGKPSHPGNKPSLSEVPFPHRKARTAWHTHCCLSFMDFGFEQVLPKQESMK